MNARVPREGPAAFLHPARGCDIAVIATQECEERLETAALRNPREKSKWVEVLKKELPDFVIMATRTLTADIAVYLNGAKGAVGVSFRMMGQSFCFLNAHLKAHEGASERRNADWSKINSSISLPGYTIADQKLPGVVERFDYVFWMGDLNYRTDLGTRMTTWAKALLAKPDPDIGVFLNNDELRKAYLAKTIFNDFSEGPISFRPTFKFDVPSSSTPTTPLTPTLMSAIASTIVEPPGYDSSKKQRMPSYTDRILFRSRCPNDRAHHRSLSASSFIPRSASGSYHHHLPPPLGARLNPRVRVDVYTDCPDVYISDHKPVYGIYSLLDVPAPPYAVDRHRADSAKKRSPNRLRPYDSPNSMAEYGVVSTGGPLHQGQPIASELSELADSFPTPSSGVIDHRLTFETDIGNALAHLAHLTSSPTETSDLSTTAHHCITRRERALLQSISTIPSAVADHTSQHLLDLLASLLLRPCLTLCVARLCRPLLIDLTGRWLLALTDVDRAERIFSRACTCSGDAVSEVASSATASPKHDLDGRAMAKTDVDTASRRLEQMLLAFSLILPSAPQLSSFATRALTMAEDASLLLHIATASTSIARTTSMVRSLYRFIRLDPSTVTPLLSWTPLYTILTHTDQSIRMYTASILSIVLGMSDGERSIFLRTHLGEASVEGHLSVLRLLEDETDAEQEAELFISASEVLTSTNLVLITSAHLCAFAVDLAGVLLPATGVSIGIQQDNLVPTLTTRRNLHSIALALSLDVPILLEGAPGVGKTALVEQAAQSLGKDGTLLKIHLGDQTDAKVLLGTYICTSTPGSFRWQPGVLTTAVMEGRWILFEDFDLAPLEVVSVLIPLLETGWLFVASRGEKVRAKEGFRVFGTRSVGTNRSVQGQAAGDGLWHKIPVKALDEGEVVEVIDHLYPRLKECGVQSQILAAFTLIEGLYKDKTISGGRTASLRDLIKWCDRVEPRVKDRSDQSGDQMDVDGEVDLPLSVREDLLREAADCFTESMPTKASRDAIVEKIGAQLGVAAHRVQFYCNVHVPNLQASPSAVTVGRVSLSKRSRDALQVTAQRPYAPTPSSLRLLESISVGISQNEPILLVGETGTGKTTVVQYLAHLTNTPLVVINMSQQSDSSDLLGGFKPVDVRVLAVSVLNEFEALFAQTFSVKANIAFLEGVRKGFKGGRWPVFVKGCRMGVKMAQGVFAKLKGELVSDEPVAKKKKTKRAYDAHLEGQWQKFAKTLTTFDTTYQKVSSALLFSFIEGALVKAIREGQWVLLDEINLATPETLDCLTGLLASATSSLVLLERGDTEPVVRHPGFRLFGCMNPANDAGKKELSGGLRGRFTEFWVDAPDATFADLVAIIKQYLAAVLPPSAAGEDLCNDIATFYTTVRGYAAQGLMYDGADHRVHFSMRTLARALTFAVGTTIKGTWILRRGVWEGCCMTFGTGLGDKSREKMEFELKSTVGKKVDVHRNRNVKNPDQGEEQRHVGVGGYYLPVGPLARMDTADESYILTPTVNQNLAYLARAVMSGKYPVLIQGPTSAGKTSMVEYLAKLTGHTCVRVNNHEGTDVAEYVGGWGEAEEGGDRGRLVWQEGILVTALRKGHWLILDELNLAPSDVLESLNRLLDDNRELFIPETQTTIRPHPSFMLFATQNPAGTTYGGRKQLSRAFRNRFLEIHFGDIPTPELHVILERRCQIAPSYAKKIVSVYKSLQSTRGRGRVFEGKHGFVTLRDLFRWAGRGCVGYEELAEEGWCLLGERMRTDEDRAIVRDVIEKEMKVKVDVEGMYEKGFETVLAAASTLVGGLIDQLVWTPTTKRLFTLVW
ncbi:AAA ATPase midasin, partial [Thoreauomyces humboldtii]